VPLKSPGAEDITGSRSLLSPASGEFVLIRIAAFLFHFSLTEIDCLLQNRLNKKMDFFAAKCHNFL
jgi:hypothetical protein